MVKLQITATKSFQLTRKINPWKQFPPTQSRGRGGRGTRVITAITRNLHMVALQDNQPGVQGTTQHQIHLDWISTLGLDRSNPHNFHPIHHSLDHLHHPSTNIDQGVTHQTPSKQNLTPCGLQQMKRLLKCNNPEVLMKDALEYQDNETVHLVTFKKNHQSMKGPNYQIPGWNMGQPRPHIPGVPPPLLP